MSGRGFSLLLFLYLFPLGVSLAPAADHLDAPVLRSAGQGGRDINDLYAFQSPGNPANTVLVLTVNPFAGMVNPFGTVSPRTFDPAVEYQFRIDNNGDAVADVTYTTTFTPAVAGIQTLATTRNGIAAATGSTAMSLPVSGGGMIQAGLFEDPFFFDLVGFNNGFNFTGDDTFALADVSAIVLEVPSAELRDGANTNIGIWARTVVEGNQVDRMGRPAINTALIPSGMKDAFNSASPADDPANFSDEVEASITSLSNASNAAALTPVLLPDILTFDTSNPGGFLNGRRLADDVIDAELNLLSAGAVTTDGVSANDVPFLNVFPYLAAPNLIPEPSSVALLAVGWLLLGCGNRRRRD
jgi:hypothetical protein